MPTISQGLVVPPGLANGQVADAGQITPLYSSLNSFFIPDNLIDFYSLLKDDAAHAISVGGTDTYDAAVSTIPAARCLIVIATFSWTSGNAPSLVYRMNMTDVTDPITTTDAATGSGMTILFYGPRSPLGSSLIGLQADSATTFQTILTNPATPVTPTTSIGFKVDGTAADMVIQNIRIWAEN